jgi:NitT/TauT family transport system substrate-binding protein
MNKAVSRFAVVCAALLMAVSMAAAENVKIGFISRDLNYLPFFVAQKRGFYAAESVPVDLVFIGGADLQLRALVAGELQVANINPDSIILWNEKGGNLKIVAGSSNAAPYYLVGGKNYKRVEDLKGARLGVASLNGGATSILLSYLKTKGLQHPRDFSLAVIAGGTPARLTALESGAIAGAVLGVPFGDMAIDRGFNKLGDTTEVINSYQFNAVNVNPAWAEKNRSTLVRFIKAHIRSLRWINEGPGQAADFLVKEMGMKPPYAKIGVDYYVKHKIFPLDGAVTLEGLKVNIQVQANDGFVKEPLPPPEKYTDLSYLKQAQKELGP